MQAISDLVCDTVSHTERDIPLACILNLQSHLLALASTEANNYTLV